MFCLPVVKSQDMRELGFKSVTANVLLKENIKKEINSETGDCVDF